MIVIVVLGIILSIAYPGYQSQMRDTRRTDGQKKLMEIMQEQQKFYSRNSTYTTDLITDLNFPDAGGGNVASDKTFYLISALACPTFTIDECVVLTAVAQGPQAVDGNLTYNSRNEKTPVAKW